MAADELARGSLEAAERYLALASPGSAAVPADRPGRFQVLLAIARLGVAQQRSNLPAAVDQAQRPGAKAEAPKAPRLRLGEAPCGPALSNPGIPGAWRRRRDQAE